MIVDDPLFNSVSDWDLSLSTMADLNMETNSHYQKLGVPVSAVYLIIYIMSVLDYEGYIRKL